MKLDSADMLKSVFLSGSRSQQLCVKLEPRGLLYIKLSLQEKWVTQVHSNTRNTITDKSG